MLKGDVIRRLVQLLRDSDEQIKSSAIQAFSDLAGFGK